MNRLRWGVNFTLFFCLGLIHLMLLCTIWLVIMLVETFRHSWKYKRKSFHYSNVVLLRSNISVRLERVTLTRSQQILNKFLQRLQ